MEFCDADCPQQAVTAYLTPAGPLLFCQHHTRQYGPKLASYPHAPIAGQPLYPPRGWESAGFGLPVNGPDRHHYPAGI